MSATDTDERPHEIIIVRRGGDDDEDAHHGGVWKIAFADFMTAMMCFFLVMWLINAANEETRAALASYFNPVKLIDRSTNRKGLDDSGKGPQDSSISEEAPEQLSETPAGIRDEMSGPATNQNSTDLAETRKHSDENLFSDPYAVLAEIAADTGTRQNISDKGEGGAQTSGPASGASGGESYRDPFAPDFWTQQVAVPHDGVEGDPDEAREQPAGADVNAAETGKNELALKGEAAPSKGGLTAEAAQEADQGATALEKLPPVEELAEEPAREPLDPVRQKREELAEQIRAELAKALEGERLQAGITVESGKDGVLISIADDMKHGMFPIGSAVPHRDLVLAMEKIGRTLSGRPGTIRINGHTDGRPFASETYDNWRLSTARAHAAYYMLVRSGLDERRVTEIAGFADRRLKLPDDPYADANRRIEILLEVPQ